jgi:hypothetical protein
MTRAAPASTRALAINGAVFTSLGLATVLFALLLDGVPLSLMRQVVAVWVVKLSIAAAFIPFARPHAPLRRSALFTVTALLLFVPVLVPAQAPATRFVVALWVAVLVMKCFDLYYGSRVSAVNARAAFAFLFASVLVLRNARAATGTAEPIVRPVLEAASGSVLMLLAMRMDWGPWPFLLEHSVKFLLIAAAVFPAVNAVMSAIRLAGGSAKDFTDSILRSRTPAEFWRRYNRIVGEFLHCDVGRSVAGVHAPVLAVVTAFAFSAALHEYLFAVVAGRVFGYQTAFFLVQALAVLATMRLKPRRGSALVGRILTIVFMLLTTTLFGANIDRAIPIYSNPLPGWLAW